MRKPISPLRQGMIDDMTIRNMSPNTQKIYTRAVANFSAFHGRSPDKLVFEDIRAYRLHLMQRGLKATSMYPIVGALRFFYGTTLGQKELIEQIPFARKEDTLPAVLTQDQVMSLLKAEPNLKMRTAYTTIYAAGLRVSEVVALTIHDIDSYPDLFRQGAFFVHKILQGTKPADIPVQIPQRFELVINLKTAKAIGVTVSDQVLLRADEVIE